VQRAGPGRCVCVCIRLATGVGALDRLELEFTVYLFLCSVAMEIHEYQWLEIIHGLLILLSFRLFVWIALF